MKKKEISKSYTQFFCCFSIVDFDLLCLMVKTIRKNQGAKKPKLILMSATHQAEDLPNYFFESETEAKDVRE